MDRHIKGLTPKQKSKWVTVANSALDSCQKRGGAECDRIAIQTAHKAVKEGLDENKMKDNQKLSNPVISKDLVNKIKVKEAAIEDINTDSISELKDNELISLHSKIHQVWKNVEEGNKDNLTSAHVSVHMEMDKRDIGHEDTDELDDASEAMMSREFPDFMRKGTKKINKKKKVKEETDIIPKHYVDYKIGMKNRSCSNCVYFNGTDSCTLIEGDISPDATCDLWQCDEVATNIIKIPDDRKTEFIQWVAKHGLLHKHIIHIFPKQEVIGFRDGFGAKFSVDFDRFFDVISKYHGWTDEMLKHFIDKEDAIDVAPHQYGHSEVACEQEKEVEKQSVLDDDNTAQKDRSSHCGIGIKEGGHITKPGQYSSLSDAQFADPVNYRYPIDAEHIRAAASYWGKPANRKQYNSSEISTITKRIDTARKKFNIKKFKEEEEFFNVKEGKVSFVLHHHFQDNSIHGDLRFGNEDGLIGLALDTPNSPVSRDKILNHREGERILCHLKPMHPSEWLKVNGKYSSSMFKIVDKGKMTFGTQRDGFHEFFFEGRKLKGIWNLVLEKDKWYFYKSPEQEWFSETHPDYAYSEDGDVWYTPDSGYTTK